MVALNEPWCTPCQEGRHEDCVRDPINCTYYAYYTVHERLAWAAGFTGESPMRRAVEVLQGDQEHDNGDGGLGSGRYLMGEMP